MAAPGRPQGTYNLGTGRGTTLSDLARALTDRINPALRPEHAPAPPGELRFSIADITAARKALSYEPRHTIENDIDAVIEDIRARASRA
jgi:UDP-glucose 4-epimerase